jgi:hypothetical protein
MWGRVDLGALGFCCLDRVFIEKSLNRKAGKEAAKERKENRKGILLTDFV